MRKIIYDIVVYGHYTHDVIVKSGRRVERLGGPPAYISEILSALGVNYCIVSKVGKDFLYKERVRKKPQISTIPTTVFYNIYNGDGRTQKCGGICEPIYPKDVVPAKVAIVGGVIGEVLPETLEEIRRKSEKVIVDIQSVIRVNKNGYVHKTHIIKTPYYDILRDADFIKASEKEFGFLDIKNLPVVILTQGSMGCTIIEKEKSTIVSTVPIKNGDSTGCGDMFVAGFAYALLKGRTLVECAQTANRTGALALKNVGVPLIKKEDVLEVL